MILNFIRRQRFNQVLLNSSLLEYTLPVIFLLLYVIMSGGEAGRPGEDAVAAMRTEITETISTLLPGIVRETLPKIMMCELPGILREIIPQIMKCELPKIIIDLKEEMINIQKAKVDAKNHIDNNPTKFNEIYKKRIKLYQSYARCEHLTKLYDECKQSDPVYVHTAKSFAKTNFT